MKAKLQQQLLRAAPVLFKLAAQDRVWTIDVPDDLFPFLMELVTAIEKFNTRYKKRYVRAMKIAMREGELEFLLHRQIPCIEKLVASARQKIRIYRKKRRLELLERAKRIGSTALFGASLLPDWKKTMPDDLGALRQLLKQAEKFAVSREDGILLAQWYKNLLRDEENAERCLAMFDPEIKEVRQS